MISEGSTLDGAISTGKVSFERDLQEEKMLHNRLYTRLMEQGFVLLELTKLVKPARDDYRYIRIRYGNRDLLPLGTGAGGRIGGYGVYHMAPGRSAVSPIDSRYNRYNALLGYLQFGKYDVAGLAELADTPSPHDVRTILEEYEKEGFLTPQAPDSWRLTPDGVYWGNNLAIDFMYRVLAPRVPVATGE
jgi:oxygen-independent coproporphyrinogen-3 oxidase